MQKTNMLSVNQYNKIYSQSLRNREQALQKKVEARAKIEYLKIEAELLASIESYPNLTSH